MVDFVIYSFIFKILSILFLQNSFLISELKIVRSFFILCAYMVELSSIRVVDLKTSCPFVRLPREDLSMCVDLCDCGVFVVPDL